MYLVFNDLEVVKAEVTNLRQQGDEFIREFKRH